jgi:SAM-dependent MidA family methyltransferase
LTAHVDFEAVAREAIEAGAAVTPLVSQGEWLTRLGIKARAQALSSANPERRLEIDEAIERLVAPDKMGSLFKVLGLHSANWPSPAGF